MTLRWNLNWCQNVPEMREEDLEQTDFFQFVVYPLSLFLVQITESPHNFIRGYIYNICMYECMYVMYVCMYIGVLYVYVCMYVCMYVCTCTYVK